MAHWEGEPVGVWSRLWSTPELEIHDTLRSTSERAREMAGAGAPDGSLVLADEQTSGRGRSGRSWASPAGAGLWFTLILRPRSESAMRLIPLRVGRAMVDVLTLLDGTDDIGLKWPNDIWWQGRKLGGILCEAAGGRTLVGVGLNVRPAEMPADLRPPPAFLDEIVGRRVSRSGLMAPLVARIRSAVQAGRPRLTPDELEALSAVDLLRDRAVRCDPGPGGIARGVEPDGALRVETDEGVRKVLAGSVRPLRAARTKAGQSSGPVGSET